MPAADASKSRNGGAAAAGGAATKGDPHQTPAMRQFHRFKQDHPGCVLFFRMGDFYEMFYDDAELAHRVLGVTLTQRTKGIPMAGVPYHSVDSYLRRMIQAGHRVAVCDQIQDPSEAKGVVDRDVTRVVTPGTLTDESMLEESAENPLAAVVFHAEERASLAWAELSTGRVEVTDLAAGELGDELARIAPREVLYCETATGEPPERVQSAAAGLGCPLVPRPAWQFRQSEAQTILRRQYRVAQLSGFGFDEDDPALTAVAGIIHYLLETQRAEGGKAEVGSLNSEKEAEGGGEELAGAGGGLAHLRPPRRLTRADYMMVDQTSLRSLEVEQTLRTGEASGSLLGTLQRGVTAMGKRLLRAWLCYPLRDRAAIEQRQGVVRALVDEPGFRDDLRAGLKDVHDIERITARLGVRRALPRDLVGLGESAGQVQHIASLLEGRDATQPYYETVAALVPELQGLADELTTACVDAPPAHLREGGLFRECYDGELDEQRSLQNDANTWLASYQRELIEATGIPSLKVGYNKVFGYYIEVTAANRDKAPDAWTRKQTLKNAERYITEELKNFEGKVLSAETKAVAREQALFAALCEKARSLMEQLHGFARAVAELDVLAGFAEQAVRQRYVQPTIADEPVLRIEAGRHPVLDASLGDRFVPNDVFLGGNRSEPADDQADGGNHAEPNAATLSLITGPNMAGKSTFIRQTALITLLAHTGGFVPADAAVVGLTDRIFTRVGANDEIHTGQSTFMVEMTETANICHHATDRSLVILDEIGRGTSTLDGLALAWAIADFLAQRRPRCLFATHYHELTRLADQHSNVNNLSVAVREWQDQIVFLHRIAAGATDRSYGIHVAQIAGLPTPVVDRANQILAQLAVSHDPARLAATTAAALPLSAPTESPADADKNSSPPPPDAVDDPPRLPQTPSPAHASRGPQMSLFAEGPPHPAIERLQALDLNRLTPMQAFDELRSLHALADPNGLPAPDETG